MATISSLLREHVTLQVRSVDRIFLHARVRTQTAAYDDCGSSWDVCARLRREDARAGDAATGRGRRALLRAYVRLKVIAPTAGAFFRHSIEMYVVPPAVGNPTPHG